MKKKLVAILIASAILSTGLIGITACGGNDTVKKGEEVDAEGWKTAINATIDATNYTVESYAETELTVKGSHEGLQEEMGVDSVDMNVKSTGDGKIYYDYVKHTAYSKENTQVKATGVPEQLQEETEYQSNDYTIEKYSVKEDGKYYTALYNTVKEGAEWEVCSASFNSGVVSDATYSLTQYYSTTNTVGSSKSLSDLYDAFTYSSGVYTATLYSLGIEYKISISVKGGYVVGYSMESFNAEEEENFTKSYYEKYIYNFSDYGKTTVKPSDGAKTAVQDYKAQ